MSAYERFKNKKEEQFNAILLVCTTILIVLIGIAINKTL